jgi:hypothetical protein
MYPLCCDVHEEMEGLSAGEWEGDHLKGVGEERRMRCRDVGHGVAPARLLRIRHSWLLYELC